MHLLNYVDEALEHCEVCRAYHVPNVGTSTGPMFSEKLQLDLIFLDDSSALNVIYACSKYSPFDPREVWDSMCGRGMGVCVAVGMCGGGALWCSVV